MIIDKLKNKDSYTNLSKRISIGLDFLQNENLSEMELGKHEIDGDNVFVIIQEYKGRDIEKGKCEAHRKYIDIQYIISGIEMIGYAPVDSLELLDEYNDENDCLFVKWEGNLIPFKEGMFAIFYPQDAHFPGLKHPEGNMVKKAVIKVKLN